MLDLSNRDEDIAHLRPAPARISRRGNCPVVARRVFMGLRNPKPIKSVSQSTLQSDALSEVRKTYRKGLGRIEGSVTNRADIFIALLGSNDEFLDIRLEIDHACFEVVDTPSREGGALQSASVHAQVFEELASVEDDVTGLACFKVSGPAGVSVAPGDRSR